MKFITNDSSKKVNISKSILEEEKKKRGIKNNDSIAEIMGLSDRHSFGNYKYCFPLDMVQRLCKHWNIRIEYLCGIDEYETIEDFYDEGFKYAEKLHQFFEIIGYEIHSVMAVDIPKKYLRNIENNRIFLENENKDRVIYHIKNDKEFTDLVSKGFLPMTYYYIYKNKKFLGILNMSELNRLYDTLTNNCVNTFDSCIKIANNYYSHSLVQNIKKDLEEGR